MLARLGFAGRLMAIVLFALIALWMAGLGWLVVSESREELVSQLFPLPEQVTAIVELIEKVAPAEQPVVLKAVNSDTLHVTLIAERPIARPGARRMPIVERFLSLYLHALQPRDVLALNNRNTVPRWGDWHFGDYWRF